MIPEDGVNGHDSIASDVGVTMLQTGTDRWHQRLQQLWLLQLAQEAQGGATNEFIRVLQILWKGNTWLTMLVIVIVVTTIYKASLYEMSRYVRFMYIAKFKKNPRPCVDLITALSK